MMGARWRVVLSFAVLVAGAAFALSRARERPPAIPAGRPTLLLLTSLPLMFGEQFSLEGGGSPALQALESRYRVVPVSVTSPADLAKGRLLLMAHPSAQTAENLVALDDWVSRGGRVMLLADPLLEWPSERPLGDPLRPAAVFMDTGLLQHWGLRLDPPEERGPQLRKLGGQDVLTLSPGALSGRCGISRDRLIARCRVGRGLAVVVADADFLDRLHLGEKAAHNLDALLAELAMLGRK
jgi:hypothetical protein